jgi:hypothetical protein
MSEQSLDVLTVRREEALPRLVTQPFGSDGGIHDVSENDGRQDALSGFGRSCPPDHALNVDRHRGLVTDHPSVVSWADVGDLAGHDVVGLAIPSPNANVSGEQVHSVVELAPLGPDDRLDVLRPPPARLEHLAADRDRTNRTSWICPWSNETVSSGISNAFASTDIYRVWVAPRDQVNVARCTRSAAVLRADATGHDFGVERLPRSGQADR